jgi:hypothetical protein
MNTEEILTYVCCALVVGLAGWLIRHTVDRASHLDGRMPVGEEIFASHLDGRMPVGEEIFLAKLSALEDRLKGEIAAVKVKLEDLEQFTHHIDRRLERLMRE